MAVPIIQTAFSAGELSPSLFGHVDLAKWHLAASTMRNCFVSYRGGAYSRAGTLFCGYSKQSGRSYPPRLITFQFSINQGLALEFGNFYMRVVSDGAFVTEPNVAITGITRAALAVVTAPAHGYANGDWVFLSGIEGMTELNGRTLIVQGATTNTFALYDIYGNPVNSSAYTAYTGGGTAARIYTLVTPYAEADLAFLKFTQSADLMTYCCWNQSTTTSYPPYALARIADDDWTITAMDFAPTVSPPGTCSGSASGGPVSGDLPVDYQYVVTSINPADGSESVASPIGDIPNAVDIATTAGSITVNWSAVAGVNAYNIYKAAPAYGSEVPAGSLFGYAGTAYGTQLVDSNIVPDFQQVPPLHLDPFAPGQIEFVNVTMAGSGLTTVTWSITTSTGSGFDGYPVIIGAAMPAFIVTNNGEGYEPGDTIAFNGAGYAGGSIDFGSTNPSASDTITLNGVVWTFVTAITGADQTAIQPTLATTLQRLVANLSASGDPALTVASYTVSPSSGPTSLVINYLTAGPGGDSYTLLASVATPSGPTLTGGSGTTGTAPEATLVVGPETGTYPSVPSYYQERAIFAGSPNNPDTYWMSQPGAFTNFDARIPTIDSDAITGTPWSVQVNGIQWLVSMPGGLVVLTGLSAWQLTGVGGSSLNPQPITPANQQAQPQAYNGASNHVPPIKIDYDILYVQAKGSIVRDLSYNFFVNIYTGADLTIISSQLFTGYTIDEWAWCEEPYKIAWAVRNDGVLLSLTYLKPQDIQGWARHDTNGLFQSVCAVTEPPVDALYLAVERFPPSGGSVYTIERMDDRIWSDVENTWCVDCGLALPQPAPNATLSVSSATGLGSLTGIVDLVGGSGYSAGTTILVVDDDGNGPGTGAVAVPTIGAGGIITAINFTSEGAGYTYPALTAVDPANSGVGFSAAAVLDNSATFTASAGVFSGGSVGQVIRVGGGIATVTAYTDAEHVIGNITSPIVAVLPNDGGVVPAASGDWTISAPVTVISGLDYLAGQTVTGLADGNVIAPQVVSASGSITLPTPATAVTVGLGFQAQLQSVYADVGQPTIQGQRKKVATCTVRIEASRGLKIGCNQPDGSTLSPPQIAPTWSNLSVVEDLGRAPYGSNVQPLYTGDLLDQPIGGGFAKPGQIALQQDSPLPMQILALIPSIMLGDTPQAQATPRQDQGRGRAR